MANGFRDHVWFIDTSATLGTGQPDDQQKFRTIRWLPGAGVDTVVLERVRQDGLTEPIWESAAGGSTVPQESRLDVRFTRGFKVTISAGGKLYLYQALDGPTAK